MDRENQRDDGGTGGGEVLQQGLSGRMGKRKTGASLAGGLSDDENRMTRSAALIQSEDGPGVKVLAVDGEPLWLGSLPSNLREVKRGLQRGFFGPPVPLGSPESQRWVNAAMAMTTVDDALRAVELLLTVVAVDPHVGAGKE